MTSENVQKTAVFLVHGTLKSNAIERVTAYVYPDGRALVVPEGASLTETRIEHRSRQTWFKTRRDAVRRAKELRTRRIQKLRSDIQKLRSEIRRLQGLDW